MSIQQIFEHVSARIPDGVPHNLGPEYLQVLSKGARVVWVPSVDTFGPPDAARVAPNIQRDKLRRVRLAGVDIYLWAETYTLAENLLADYLNVLHDEGGTAMTLVSGDWGDPEDIGWLTAGVAYRLVVQFAVPIVKTQVYQTLESIAQDCAGLTVSNTGD